MSDCRPALTPAIRMSTEVHEGQILAGKFRIERVLGQGGMGVVVAATHIQLEERVALKFLLPEALSNPEAVARFAREARAAVKIKSEHVARVSDVGTLDSGSPYMVMEYLEGQDLADWVRKSGAMRQPDAVEFVLQACEAIAEAHALGIVHRDLKPANLFVTRRVDGSPCIKVLDFGISKLTVPGSTSDMGMTRTSTVMGSPLYMSPEQMSSTRNVDARTDIWALGIILYEVLSGRVPFEAETMPQLCGMILQDAPRPLRELRPDVPDGLQWVVLRCLEKNRDARFANVAELAAALVP
ncbi:MAG TPA: serine/threonine-protein kinase, partial [Polyangiaceae bacterium]|nr:serine/threonine-protein kinase [Polyangiaceae bacterium]